MGKASSGRETWLMVVNVIVTIVDLVANVVPFGATSPFDPDGSNGVVKLRVGGIAAPPAATFSIWGIIFGWIFVFLFAQFGFCCQLKEDVMKATPSMIVAQLAQACYGLGIYLIPDKGVCLLVASVTITAALAAFLYTAWLIKDYPVRTYFWLFGYAINAAWLVVATYVQWSSLFVFNGLPMNTLQIPFLLATVLVICVLSLAPVFRYPPAFFCVSLWTFTFQALLWAPQPEADENFSEAVQKAYRTIVAVVAVLSLPGAAYVFYKKLTTDDDYLDVVESQEDAEQS